MTTDDLAGILREHQYVTPESEDEYGAHNYTCQCGELMHECYEDDAWAKLAAHQAAVIAAAGWVQGREEWAVKHHGYGNSAHYEPCADEEGARRRAALSAWSGYVEPTPVRRYVTDWEEVRA